MRQIFANDLLTPPPRDGIPVALEEAPHPSRIASLMSAADELTSCRDADSLLRLATELARSDVGLERVGLFMLEQRTDRMLLRGTWGTGLRRETVDEHDVSHELSPRDYRVLINLQLSGAVTVYRGQAPLVAIEKGRERVIGEGWFAATPLIAGRDVIGVLYNDAALTGSPLDEGTQALAGLFCSLVAVVYASRCRPWPRRVGSGDSKSSLIERALDALRQDLRISGQKLAADLGVSPGHLARRFKREMGMTFVDYRAQLRLDRFFELSNQELSNAGPPKPGRGRSNLVDVALAAGFGSYSQFHRVYTKLLGESPRAYRRRVNSA